MSSDHEIYARLLLAKAQAHLALKNQEEALACAERAEKIFNAWYERADAQRKQASIQKLLGDVWAVRENPQRAFSHYEKAARIYEKLFVTQKIDEISELYMAMTLTALALKDKKNMHAFLKTHAQLFGLDHFRTKAIFKELDDAGVAGLF